MTTGEDERAQQLFAEEGTGLSQDIFERAAALKRAGVPFVLATVVWSQRPTSAKPGAKGIVTADGALFGWVGGSCAQPAVIREGLRALADGKARILRLDPDNQELSETRPGVVVAPMTCHSGGAIEVFLEPILPPLQLVVVGDSPVAEALIRLGQAMGYRVVPIRAGAGASGDDSATLPPLQLDSTAHGRRMVAVVATMGSYDEEAVERVLSAGAEFVALVASRRRFEAVHATLLASGVPPASLARIKAPAGLDIGASAPEEIAVAILAEIIAHRAASSDAEGRAGHGQGEPETAIDPVCGMEVSVASARFSANYQGIRYYFCCPACRKRFLSDPSAYVRV